MKKNAIHEFRTRVRYQETDQMGVVYHSNYLIYFELGRTEFLRSLGFAYRDLEERGIFLAVTQSQLKFMESARYDDPLLIQTKIENFGPASIQFHYTIFHETAQRLLCQGTTKLACLNQNKKPSKLPKDLLDYLKTHVA